MRSRTIGETEYVFQDFIAGRDEYFCQKQLVPVDNATRSFSAKVAEVAFSDGTKWNESDAEWKPIEKQQPINYLLKDTQLIKQYHIKYGNSCEYIAKTDRDLVLCSCGTVNKAGENSCHKCRNNLSTLLSLDIPALTAEKDARLANEAKAAEEKRMADEKAAEEAKKRAKKAAKIAGIVAACAAVCVGLALLTVKVIVPTVKYNNAVELLNNGQYYEAKVGFSSIIGFKDSKEYYESIIFLPQKRVSTDSNGNKITTTYEYDSAGNLTKEVCTYSYGVSDTYTYEYDSAGNMTKEVRTNSDGDSYTDTYEYDSAGNMTKMVETDFDGDTETYMYTYSDFIYIYEPQQ